jgi:regulator of sigma E protease
MTTLFGSVWWLIVSIGILVTFHEFGHFWVARRFGVHILRFSVGFGRPLLKHVGRDGTEFVIAAIPLGGYVKMLDEREFEVDPRDAQCAFNRKPVWQRMAIAAAGPAANFLLCFVLLWTMFVIGQPDYLPIVGRADAMAAQAGFVPGDRLLSIDGERVPTWTDAALALSGAAMDRKPVQIEVARDDGSHAFRSLPLQQLAGGLAENEALSAIGLVPKQFMLPAVIGRIERDGPIAQLHVGDRILAVNGVAVTTFDQLATQTHALARIGTPLRLGVQRGNARFQVDVLPKMRDPGDGKPALTIGIGAQTQDAVHDGLRRYGPIGALGASAHEMGRQMSLTFHMLSRMVTEGAMQNLSGPIAIARYANDSAQMGLAWFLFFLAILSLSLGIMNLLPVPILDGGHLLYYLIELVKGSPVSERSLAVGQYIGLALLGGLMCVAFYNDILRPLS